MRSRENGHRHHPHPLVDITRGVVATTLALQADPGSILWRISTQGLKIIEERVLPLLYIDSKWLDFCVFSDKDVKS
jgi:hypothetical protein